MFSFDNDFFFFVLYIPSLFTAFVNNMNTEKLRKQTFWNVFSQSYFIWEVPSNFPIPLKYWKKKSWKVLHASKYCYFYIKVFQIVLPASNLSKARHPVLEVWICCIKTSTLIIVWILRYVACIFCLSIPYMLFCLSHFKEKFCVLNKSSKQSSNYSKTQFHEFFEL